MKKIVFIIISIITILLSIIFILNPKKEFSENENRFLATFPKYSFQSLKDGKYIKELEEYITDHFPYRDAFVGFKTRIELTLGKKDINEIYIGKDEYMLTKYEEIDPHKIIEKINNFKDKNSDNNINLILLPSSITIYQEKLPKFAITDSELAIIDTIYKNVNVKTIDTYDSLVAEKKNHNVFYKTDHHYTTYGAFVTYQDYCRENNIVPNEQEFFNQEKVTDKFYGTLYSKTNNYNIKPDEIILFKTNTNYRIKYMDNGLETNTLYDEDYLKEKDKYSVFLSNNHSLIEITNNDTTSREEVLVIKDSYGNSFVPFIAEHYKKIHVVDLRYNLNSMTDYLQENDQIKDVIILYNINTINEESSIYNLR